MLGGLLCLLLTPIQAFIWSGVDSPPLVLAFRPLLELAGRIHDTFGPRLGLDEYYFYGRMFFLVYLAAIAGLVGLHVLQSRAGRWERTWFRVVLVGLAVALSGDIVAYWGGRGDVSESPVQGLGFTVEMLAVLVVLIGSVFYGRVTLHAGRVPGVAAWLLVIAGPVAVPVVFLTEYIPHGAVLPFSLAIAVTGYFLLTRRRGRRRRMRTEV
jgi:hypothetical protein